MNNINILSKIYFIFYIPGSMGSLLSVLIRSQLEKEFNFIGFSNETAHSYTDDTFYNTHDYPEYLNFKKTNTPIEKHLIKNIKNNNSIIQRCDINWCNVFKNKNFNSTICYIDDYQLKLTNFYIKLKKITLESINSSKFEMNFKINKNHKDYEKIIFMKTITWWINQERKYLKLFPSINLLPIIQKKNFNQLENICKITNTKILNTIIDDYNSKQIKNTIIFPEFSKFIEKYLKKYS